jgi:hypothetical protein
MKNGKAMDSLSLMTFAKGVSTCCQPPTSKSSKAEARAKLLFSSSDHKQQAT